MRYELNYIPSTYSLHSLPITMISTLYEHNPRSTEAVSHTSQVICKPICCNKSRIITCNQAITNFTLFFNWPL